MTLPVLLTLVLVIQKGHALFSEFEAFDIACTNDDDCSAIKMASCQEVYVPSNVTLNFTSDMTLNVTLDMTLNVTSNITSNVTSDVMSNVTLEGTVERRCGCDKTQDLFAYSDGENRMCRMHVRLGKSCDDTSVCVDSGATCQHAGDLHNTYRCQCDIDDILAVHNGTKVCAQSLSGRQDPHCETCDDERGRCYDVTGDGRRDGCQCPVSLSGEDCEIMHVFVDCTVDDFRMMVCYDPHEGVDLAEMARMHPEGYGTDVECRGVPDNGTCKSGTWRLDLPLAEGKRERCGTYMTQTSSSIKYENRIFVDKGTGQPDDYIMFKTYCLFQTHATASFGGLGVFAVADGWAGEESKPRIQLSVERALGDLLSEGVPIRLGDKVRFRITLNPEGDYAAVRVESCLFSSAYTSRDHMAQTVRILDEGCPLSFGSYLNAANNWYVTSTTRPWEVTTGLVKPPKMAGGGATYLHCMVKVCLRGEISLCKPKTCTPGTVTQHQSHGRKKRLASEEHRSRRDVPDMSDSSIYLELIKGIYFDDGNSSGDALQANYGTEGVQEDVITFNRLQFAVGTSILLLLLITFIIATIVLATQKCQRRTSKVAAGTSGGATRPPQFHIPRKI